MKILIVQTGFLGDIILSTPVIKGVNTLFPEAEISFLTTPAGKFLVCDDPLVKEIFVYDKRNKDKGIKGIIRISKILESKNFDMVFSLHKSYRTSIMLFLSKIKKRIGFKKAKLAFLYNIKETRNINEHDAVRNLSILNSFTDIKNMKSDLRLFAPKSEAVSPDIEEITKSKYVFMSPGSAWKTKRWHETGYNETAKYFNNIGFNVVVSGSEDEKEICSRVCENTKAFNLSGKINLSQLKFIISNAALVVCNDSMALHMASAFKIPCVCIFCSTVPEFGYGPWKNKSIVIEKKLECRPCGRHGHNKCPKNTEECMQIPSEQVIKACRKIMDIQ